MGLADDEYTKDVVGGLLTMMRLDNDVVSVWELKSKYGDFKVSRGTRNRGTEE